MLLFVIFVVSVGEQRALRAQAAALQVRGGIEHLLHAGAALRAFVADHHHVARLHLLAEDALHRVFLALVHPGLAGELPDGFIHPGGLHDAALLGDVAVEHGQPSVGREGMFLVADDAVLAVGVERLPAPVLTEGDLGRHPARRCTEEGVHRFVFGALDVPLVQGFAQARAVHGRHIGVQQAGAVEFTEDGPGASAA